MSDYLSTLILINGAPAGVTVQVNDVSANGTMYRASYDIMQDGQVAQSGFGFVTNDGKRLFLGNYMDLTQKLEMPTPKPAIDINVSGRPYRGAENATVTIVEFADFQCPYCKLAGANVEGVLSTYSGSVKYYLVHFPLSMHQNAQKASEAFECAMLQGEAEGWALYDTMFAKGAGDGTGLAVADLKAYAQNLSLDAAKFNKCLDDNQTAAKVLADASYGAQLGVSGTPTFFVNGKEAVGGAAMQSAVEAILKK
jgi:protein-disulfide isomerase